MKKIKIFLFLLMLWGIIPHIRALELQQPITVSGIIVDAADVPIPGATILITGSTKGTISDSNGKFSLSVPDRKTTLRISFVGYQTQTVTVGDRKELRIVMEEAATDIDEVVVVAYGTQKKVSVTASISSVQTKELRQNSAANLSSALAGRLPGLTALQTSGQPGNDAVTLYLRGLGTTNDNSPLILIDGIPRDNISVLDPNEVASVSILKDASATAVFGVRGANGVILVTTRSGEQGKAELSISVDQSFQHFIASTTRLHSWEFAELRNRAYLNDHPGAPEANMPYTSYMIDMYKSGADRVFYPDRDVFHDYFRDWAPQTRMNANLRGGADKVSYFLNAGYVGQGGQFYTEPKSFLGYDPSFRMDRYTFRSNVDYSIADNLKLSLKIGTYLQKMNSPQTAVLFSGSMAGMVENMIASLGRGSSITQGLMANEHIQWEEALKQNYALDLQLFKSLSFTVDLFRAKRDNILITRNTVPIIQGVPLGNIPKVNMGRVDSKGYELELAWQKIINRDLSFIVKGHYAYNENKQIMVDEPVLSEEYAYRYRRTGYSIGQPFGYQVDYSNGNGYINTQAELDEAVRTYQVGGVPRLGDLKYVDANDDGVIDEKDYVPIGYSGAPKFSYGLSGSLTYRNLDFAFLFSGVAKVSHMYTGWGATEFGLAGFYTDWHLQAWTQERYENGEKYCIPHWVWEQEPVSKTTLFTCSTLRSSV
jgi:TonB-dependent SusC/RagA subfamily outer membrane receptor